MINDSSVIAIIPARGGSKGLPNKNIRSLSGKPLIAWSIEQALASKTIDKVIVSSDCPKIIEVANEYGATVPFVRPAHLATDSATTLDVIIHAHEFYRETHNCSYDYSVVIEPTSPIREKDDIDSMVTKLDNLRNHFDSAVSIGEVSDHPSLTKICEHDELKPYLPNLDQGTRRQDYDTVYWPFGGLFVNKTNIMFKEKSLYARRLTYYKLKKHQCCEIDDLYDFIKTEAILNYKWRN